MVSKPKLFKKNIPSLIKLFEWSQLSILSRNTKYQLSYEKAKFL